MPDNLSDEVLRHIMEDGTFDDLRKHLIGLLKQNEALQQFTQDAVLNSKTLMRDGAEKLHQKELFEGVRKELEASVLEEALKVTWGVLSSSDTPMPADIEEKVHEALCAVHIERARADGQRH